MQRERDTTLAKLADREHNAFGLESDFVPRSLSRRRDEGTVAVWSPAIEGLWDSSSLCKRAAASPSAMAMLTRRSEPM
jgi:hypothetical protein